MKRRLLNRCCRWVAVVMLAMAPSTALAQEDEEVVEARLQGFANNVTLPSASEGFVWVTMIFMAVICCGGLYKDAKRSHLD